MLISLQSSGLKRAGLCLAVSALALLPRAVCADPAPFELAGPDLRIEVTRSGKTLPISQVPSLSVGDRISVQSPFSEGESARFLIASAFLRGATNPPPSDWMALARSWKGKDKDNSITATVPDGARQMILMLVPETGGAQGVLRDAVRGKPGEFVRASQELNQASLDHSRLETFMAAITAQDNSAPENLAAVAPVLASSLSIKLQEDCLDKVIRSQASCLMQNREQLVLADVHSSSLAETITGTPTDLALQLSNTREAGGGYYSPYIAVARDVAKIFGAFSNPQFDYLPALTRRSGDRMSLLLNAAPSFQKPKSVMVVAMPAVEADLPPRLRSAAKGPLCTATETVLPVEGAPLVFSTSFAHDMKVRLTAASGERVDVPVTARPERGGYLLSTKGLPPAFSGEARAHLGGMWGFVPFDGPDFVLQGTKTSAWSVDGGAESLVVGRDNDLILVGGAAACVEQIKMRTPGGGNTALSWSSADGQRLNVRVPLADGKPGTIDITVHQRGGGLKTLVLRANTEPSRIEALELREGDQQVTLIGQRLDQVRSLQVGQLQFRPGGIVRRNGKDRLTLIAPGDAGVPKVGSVENAIVVLNDGRRLRVPVHIEPAQSQAKLLSRTIYPGAPSAGKALTIPATDLLPQTGEVVWSVKAGEGSHFDAGTVIEVSADREAILATLTPGHGLGVESPDVAIATLRARDLPAAAVGALQFRVSDGGANGSNSAGNWMPLATLVRLPTILEAHCLGEGGPCTVVGRDLFLLDAVSTDDGFGTATRVPSGFTGRSLQVSGKPSDNMLRLRLRDAPEEAARLTVDQSR